MNLQGVKIGFALTGSHCTLADVMPEIKRLIAAGADVYPILSPAVQHTDTRFGQAVEWIAKLQEITGHEPIRSITDAEPIGPQKLLDVVIVAPCTGNTLAKIANGITDTPVLMAVKAHLRNQRPVVLAISTYDGLGMNARNIGLLLNMKNIYMVPFGQDNPKTKPNSLVARMDYIPESIDQALQGKQIQPVLMGSKQ